MFDIYNAGISIAQNKVIKANTFFKLCAIKKPISAREDKEVKDH